MAQGRDDNLDVQRELKKMRDTLDRLIVRETGNAHLPWAQRVLNPFPLASSGAAWGDQAQPWGVNILTFYVSVFVNTTNNGSHFWTIELIDALGNVLASVTTSAIAANTYTRLSDSTITQPASSNAAVAIRATATGSPGSIYIVPALDLV